MAKLEKLSDTKWKQPLQDREKELRLWHSQRDVADFCHLHDGTKRRLKIESEHRTLVITDDFQITSGCEIYFPKDLQDEIKEILLKKTDAYFTVEVLDV